MNETEILMRNPLFKGMDADTLAQAKRLLKATREQVKKEAILHQPWTRFTRFGLVLSGTVQACCDDRDGSRIIMANVQPGVTFGDSLCYLGIEDAPVYIYAPEDAEVMWLSTENLFGECTDPPVPEMQKRFTAMLAGRTLAMNNRIQILSAISIREKLMTCFRQLSPGRGEPFRVPFRREDLAIYIGANRSAMCRELSRMKADGLIDYHGNTFILK